MFDWLAWAGDLLKVVGDLIPKRILVPLTHRAVKFKHMTEAIELEPGKYWYVPFFSSVHIVPVVKQTISLGVQRLVTSDGRVIHLESSILYEVTDLKKAMTDFYCFEVQVDDDSKAVISHYINELTYEGIVNNIKGINAELTNRIKQRLKMYGIEVHRLQLTTLTTGFPLLLISSNERVSEV